jgi:hypothetical protein
LKLYRSKKKLSLCKLFASFSMLLTLHHSQIQCQCESHECAEKYDGTEELIWAWMACRREVADGQIGDAGINKMYINECCIEVA